MLYRGRLVDGRHRVRACNELGIVCPTKEYECDESGLLDYVVSLNSRRRSLSQSQLAMVAARIANLKHGHNRFQAKTEVDGSIDPSTSEASPPITNEQAAKLMNVSPISVKRATAVREKGIPELAQAVKEGTVKVSKAAKIAAAPKAEQAAKLKEATAKRAKGKAAR